MDAVPETLQQLVRRRLDEMGKARGRNEPLSLREAYLAVDKPGVSYELVRRVEREGHTNIGDAAIGTIATMLGVREGAVRSAARLPPDLGDYVPPSEARALTRQERDAIDLIIRSMARDRSARSLKGIGRGLGRLIPTSDDPAGPAGADAEHWEEAAYAPPEPPGPHEEE